MEIEQKVDALSSVIETLAAKFDTFVAESKIEVKGVADQAAVDEAVAVLVAEALAGIADVEKSIDDADIPAVVKESLKESARKGEDITENLAGAVAIVAEAKKEFTAVPPSGQNRGKVIVVDESLDSEAKKNFRVGRWS